MSQLFPPEIIEDSVEIYSTKIQTRSKIIYGIFLLLILTIFVILPLVHIQISVQSRGIVRTPVENIVIQSALNTDVVHSYMIENKKVYKGDTLLVLNTEKLQEQIEIEKRRIHDNLQFSKDLKQLLTQKPQQLLTPKYVAEYNQYLAKLKELQLSIKYLKKEYEITTTLHTKNASSEFEYLQQKNQYEKAVEQLESLKNEYFTFWQSEQTRLELENQVLESNIKQYKKEKRQYLITAPATGNLIQVAGIGIGNFITAGQPLGYISVNDTLLVECYISPHDIAYVKKNQLVKFQIDAFNYREWGFVEGHVLEILNDVVMMDNKPMFRVRCQLHKSCLQLKSGYQGCIQKGLTLTGQFQLNKRTLWQLMFDKVDNWINPKIIEPS